MTTNDKQQELADNIILGEKIKLLWGFMADLIPEREKIKQVAENAAERQDNAMSMAPILGAYGLDWEEAEAKAKRVKRRAEILYDLLCVLAEDFEAKEEDGRVQEDREQLKKMFNL